MINSINFQSEESHRIYKIKIECMVSWTKTLLYLLQLIVLIEQIFIVDIILRKGLVTKTGANQESNTQTQYASMRM